MLESSTHNGSEQNRELRNALPLDVIVLRGVFEKCTRRYEGKYPSALFDINVCLDAAELTQLGILIERAKRLLKQFTESHPAYPGFEAVLHDMRESLGTFGEAGRIIGDPSATTAKKDRLNGGDVPAIRVPAAIKGFCTWAAHIECLEAVLKTYCAGNARGMSAVEFGKNVKEVYRLIKESKTHHQGDH